MSLGMVVEGIRITVTFDPVTTALLQEQRIVADPAQLLMPPGGRALDRSVRQHETLGTVLDTQTFPPPIVVGSETSTSS
jgi:hypothetical protein